MPADEARHPTQLNAALGLCRSHFIGAACFSALVNLLYIAPTVYMLQVYDRVVPTHGLATLAVLTVALLFALVTLAVLDRIRVRLLVRAGLRIDAALAPAILDATLARSQPIAARQAMRDFDAARQTFTGAGALALFDAPWMPVYLLICTLLHPWIGALALVGVMALSMTAWCSERVTRASVSRAQLLSAAIYAGQDAILARSDIVRALGMRTAMVRRQMRQREALLHQQVAAGFASGNYTSFGRFLRLALQSCALGLGAWLAAEDQISAGAIFASSFLIARALAPAEQLIASWRSLQQARNIMRQLNALLGATSPEMLPTRLPTPRGALRLEDVTVVHERREVPLLTAIHCDIAAGEAIGIIGPSGAGKSTLLRLLAGIVPPNRGILRIDGAEASQWDAERLARHVGYLPQDPQLFGGTIKENICRFATERLKESGGADRGSIAAAQAAGIHEMILGLPGGYEYVLDAHGGGLSVGQAHRIALARALYGDPVLLLLDEPNAHLDGSGDVRLLEVLQQAKARGCTIVLASHKRTILPVLDRLIVLNSGRIQHIGPRDAILAALDGGTARTVAHA
ncbi:type I secretion system permease/ATPase [Sphingomonas trueperi]|uniref:type I secretion system permease/ATPase n=1 Tax=Sphingomonas trueperi TaxID=53317 RepID=UPI000EAFDB96